MSSPRPARPAVTPLQRALVLATACLWLLLAAVAWVALDWSYRQHARAALDAADHVAHELAVQVREAFDGVDQTTLLVQALIDQGIELPLQSLGDAMYSTSAVTRSIYRTDESGHVVDSTSPDVPLNIADQDDFKLHAHQADRGLVLGAPTPDHLRGGMTLPATRRLTHPDGRFAGVVVAMLDPAALLRGVHDDVPADTAVSVLGANGVFLVRAVDGQVQVGQRMALQQVLEGASQTHETLRPVPSGIDQVERFISAAPVDNYPYHAVAAPPAHHVNNRYIGSRNALWSVAATLAALMLGGAALLWYLAGRSELSRLRAKKAEALYRATSEGSLDALFMLRVVWNRPENLPDFVIAKVNTRGAHLLRDDAAALVGQTLHQRLPWLVDGGHLDAFKAVIMTGERYEAEIEVADIGVRAHWLHIQAVPIEDGIALITRDVSDHRAAQQRLHELARVDALTGLANRLDSEDHLRRAVARAGRSGGALALVFLDLDGFKSVNDTFGHDAGDQVLVEVAERLRGTLRTSDHISRLGGDEFLITLEDSGGPQDRMQQCERILEQLCRPHTIAGGPLFITPSLGLALYQSGESPEDFRKRADSAMYEAKRAGKACMRVASSSGQAADGIA